MMRQKQKRYGSSETYQEVLTDGKNKYKEKNMAMPIEKHDTAAWANIEKTRRVSGVTEPGEQQVRNAKDYVDANQK